MSKRPLSIGIIGDGLMAKEHSMAWRNVNAVFGDVPVEPHLAVLVQPNAERARMAAEQYGFARSSTSWQEVVDDLAIDVIDIVTPNVFHREVAVAAARAGKHIWCEKPLGLGPNEALRMTEAAEQAGVTTMVGFTYLQNPGIQLARQLIDQGELGELFSFTAVFSADTMIDPAVPFTWRTDRAKAGGGALGDLGSHLVSIARMLVGDIARVSGLTRIVVPERADAAGITHRVDNDDQALTMIEFASGVTGSLQASRVQTGRAFEVSFTVTGTRGAIRFSQQDNYKLEVSLASDGLNTHGFRTVELGPGHGDFGRLWPMSGINIGLHELKIFEVRCFIDGILTGNPVSPDFREGWEIERVINAIERSASSRTWVTVD